MIQSTSELYFDVETHYFGNLCLISNQTDYFGNKHLDNHPIDPGEDAETKDLPLALPMQLSVVTDRCRGRQVKIVQLHCPGNYPP
ncbi:hypothetical protein V6N13_059071 [Hibiscus sabdariffa]